MLHPTRVTLPGNVRLPPPAKGEKPLYALRQYDEKGRLTGTIITVPPGKRIAYALAKGGDALGARGTYVVTAHDEEPQEPVMAELEHEVEEKEGEIRHRTTFDNAGKLVPAHTESVVTRKVLSVTAKSTHPDHAGVEAKGVDAADAVAQLRAKIAERTKATGAADADAAKKADDAKTAADVAKELHGGSKPPPALPGKSIPPKPGLVKTEPKTPDDDDPPGKTGERVDRHG
jgi:hypothetical protein